MLAKNFLRSRLFNRHDTKNKNTETLRFRNMYSIFREMNIEQIKKILRAGLGQCANRDKYYFNLKELVSLLLVCYL